jgi:hypothetical protein
MARDFDVAGSLFEVMNPLQHAAAAGKILLRGNGYGAGWAPETPVTAR